MRKRNREILTDKEGGIRTITQIENLPVSALTDEEICKLFYYRFEAKSLIMLYEDKEGIPHIFGRLLKSKAGVKFYARLKSALHTALDFAYLDDFQELE